jgi:amidophosphoribosyltransferase
MLLDLQNRGQLAAGITSYRRDRSQRLNTYKQLGTVQEAFRTNHPDESARIMAEHAAPAAIGHVRYATSGADDRDSSQPYERKHLRLWKWYAFAFNGQITNYQELKREFLTDEDQYMVRDTDTELLMHCISQGLRGPVQPSVVELFSQLADRFEGAWNIAFLNAQGEMVVARDPVGFRPMSWAFDGSLFAAASEDVALENLGFREVQTLAPGELVYVREDRTPEVIRFAKEGQLAHCALEWVYFANPASTLDGSSVYAARAALGEQLAEMELARGGVPLDDDTIVVPVPETAVTAADAMAFRLSIRAMEGVVRNRYVGRTFIQGSGSRIERAKMKYTPIRRVLEGKRVLLVEDTIVRATTMRVLIHELRNRGGAREIHVRIACPPVIGPCFYGLDVSTVSELFVPTVLGDVALDEEGERKLAEALGVDSVRFLPPGSLPKAIGIHESRLCQACMTGEHPCETGASLYRLALRNARLKHLPTARTLEIEEPKIDKPEFDEPEMPEPETDELE